MAATKSAKRIDIIKKVITQLKDVSKNENIETIYPHLLNEVTRLYEEYKGLKSETARERAKKNLLWEGNVNTTVHNVLFFGTSHRPDLVLQFEEGLRIAIEIKRGDSGDSIREGIGQSLVYSACSFDFVVLLFIDTSKEGKIVNSMSGDKESRFIEQLWFEHNVLFSVI